MAQWVGRLAQPPSLRARRRMSDDGADRARLDVPLWLRFQVRGEQWQFTEQVSLLPSLGLNYVVGVDGLALVLVLLTTVLSAAAALASWTVTFGDALEDPPRDPIRGQAVSRESAGFEMTASAGQAVSREAREPAIVSPG